MTKRKLPPRDRQRRADSVTVGTLDDAARAGRDRFAGPMTAVVADMKRLLAGRSPRALTGAEAVEFISLKAEFDGIAIAQKRFMEADAAFRLNPGEGGETVDA